MSGVFPLMNKGGINVTDQPMTAPPPAPPVKPTWMPAAAGILSIVAGIFEILGGFLIGVIFHALASMFDVFERASELGGFGLVLGVPMVILGIVAVVGGIFALQRKMWGLGLAGSICALFAGGTLLGILSIVFISVSKKEFIS